MFISHFISVQFFSVEKTPQSSVLTASNFFEKFFSSSFFQPLLTFLQLLQWLFIFFFELIAVNFFGRSGRDQLFDHAPTNFSTAANNFLAMPRQSFRPSRLFFRPSRLMFRPPRLILFLSPRSRLIFLWSH